jgi:autotransporter translocation and assembly factor TamB
VNARDTSDSARQAAGTGAGGGAPPPGADDARQRRRRRFRPLRWLLVALLQLLILALLLLGLVLGTQTGLRMAVALVEGLAPDMLSVQSVDGRVLGELRISGLSLTLPGLDLELGSLHLDWSPAALFGGRLRVRALEAADIDIVMAPSPQKPEPEPFKLPQIRLPIGIDLDRLLVERLRFRQQGAPASAAIVLERAELSATALGERVDLRQLTATLTQPEASAAARGQARLTGAYPIDLTLDWHFAQPPALELTGQGRVGGDLERLIISHRIDGSVAAALEATVTDALTSPAWDASIELTAVDLPELAAGAPPVDLSGRLSSNGDLDTAGLTGTLNLASPDLPDAGRLRAGLDVGWQQRVLAIRGLRISELARDTGQPVPGGATLDLAGTISLAGQVPQFAVAGSWQMLRWPLVGEPIAGSPQGRIDVHGTADDYVYGLQAAAAGQQIPETSLRLAGSGDQQQTSIEDLAIDTLGGHIEAKGRVAWAPDLDWTLAVSADGIDPGQQFAGLDGRLALKAESQGGPTDGFDYKLRLDAALDAYPAAVLIASGRGSADDARLEQLRIETLGGQIEGQGRGAWKPHLTWDVQLSASDLDPGVQYQGLDGRIGLTAVSSGGLKAGFSFTVGADASLTDYPPARLDLAGSGADGSVEIDTLEVSALGGRIDGRAKVGWAPRPSWDATLTLADIDPGKALADWPGSLGGQISSQGRIGDSGPVLSAAVRDFGGRLRGYPVRAGADLSVDGQTVVLDRLNASSGATTLTASGRAGEQLDLAFDFSSPDLSALLPDAGGQLAAEARISGRREAPALALTLNGTDVQINGQGIAAIEGSADVGLGAGGEFRIDIDGSNLIVGSQRFDELAVRGSGRIADHRLSVTADGEALSLAVEEQGGVGEGGTYDGALTRLDLRSTLLGDWGLRRRAPISVGQGRVAAGPLCIDNGRDSGACVAFEQPEAGRFTATMDMDRFGLDTLNPLLPELTVMTGFVRGRANFTAAGTVLTGNALIEIPEGAMEIALPDTKDKLVFAGTRLAAEAGGGGLDAMLVLPLEGVGSASGRVSLPGFSLGGGSVQPLRGGLEASLDNLGRLSVLFPDLTDITGTVAADINLGGTLAAPDLRGNVAVRGVGVTVPVIGLEVSDVNLTARSTGPNSMDIDGGALVGGGRLSMNGSAQFAGGAPQGRFRVTGDKLKVADSKEYFALVSLAVDGGVGPGGGALKGRVKVPEARIMPRTIPSGAVQPSPDVVTEDQAGDQSPLPFSINLLAELGDAVQVDAFGLRGRLQGQLRVIKEPGGDLVGDGQLEVVDGTYRVTLPGLGLLTSVGKPLTIEQGIVVFAKTPLDNPGLILNAQRQGGDITAGVRVHGTLKSPTLSFFSQSDPGMTQSEITSYLVTGIPPKRGAAADERSLSVGTYVRPKLYMEYESSLGDQSDKVKMRYDLTDRIEIQAETGESQGADIFFNFEN